MKNTATIHYPLKLMDINSLLHCLIGTQVDLKQIA